MNGAMVNRPLKISVLMALVVMLVGCVTPQSQPRPVSPQAHYKVGKPYKVNGRWYYPREEPDYEDVGLASWYGDQFHGRRTANGEVFDMTLLSAAHTTLPLPSLVEVTNLKNGRRTIVRVNDRGPFVGDRIIDMSRAAAKKLGFEREGIAKVRVRYLGRARLAAAAPKDRRQAKAEAVRPLLAEMVVDSTGEDGSEADALSRIIAVSASDQLTAGAEAFAVAETEAEVRDFKTPAGIEPGLLIDESRQSDASLNEPKTTDASLDQPKTTIALAPAELDPGRVIEALYAVQIAVFSDLNNLEATKIALDGLGVLRIARIERPQGVLYRVRLGPFQDRQTAATNLAAVREAGYGDAKIITIEP